MAFVPMTERSIDQISARKKKALKGEYFKKYVFLLISFL